ncbi:hypothetical protein EMCRGX_G014780 [Ephydatia muelleri]
MARSRPFLPAGLSVGEFSSQVNQYSESRCNLSPQSPEVGARQLLEKAKKSYAEALKDPKTKLSYLVEMIGRELDKEVKVMASDRANSILQAKISALNESSSLLQIALVSSLGSPTP